ncbi:hypothetical protein JB92DRAFT_3114313 [Gautieria morchelliformis]|nr:hypothetical protein JB92DRAFT_3114313 [Gautieria morchelliformis]
MSKGLDERNKANRGFNHPLTGRLLCPAKLDYMDLSIQQQLKSGDNDEIQGLLRSELLVQAYKCIFLGPSAWVRKDGKSKTTRASKAVLCEMDRVTTRSLAYVAVLTYFAMSSSENNQKSGATFELSAMYWQIVNMLEDDDLKEEADALLLWWNQQIHPSKLAREAASTTCSIQSSS